MHIRLFLFLFTTLFLADVIDGLLAQRDGSKWRTLQLNARRSRLKNPSESSVPIPITAEPASSPLTLENKSSFVVSESATEAQKKALLPSIEEDLLKDIERLQAKQRTTSSFSSSSVDINSDNNNELGRKAEEIFGALFIANFALVLVFLAWFLAAVVLKSTYPDLLLTFQGIFQPVVVPSLTVLMAGSIASGAISKLKEGKDKSS